MFNVGLSLLLWAWAWAAFWPPAQIINTPQVHSPRPGQVLQGSVEITGSTRISGFVSAEVSFAYDDGQSAGWYLIQQSQQPVEGGLLATWDTTTITDGDYRLRVLVHLEDGRTEEAQVSKLLVRNYTSFEQHAGAASLEPGREPSPTPTRIILPTATALPANPAEVSSAAFIVSIAQGITLTLIGFLGLGIYLWIRRVG